MKDPIVQIGDLVLRKAAEPVLKKDFGSRKLASLIAKMKKALDAEEYGVAIAAPQVGSSLRIFVVAGKVYEDEARSAQEPDLKRSSGLLAEDGTARPFSNQISAPPDRVYINPELTRMSRRKKEMAEGCLSVRGQYGTVLRHEKATIKAQDEHGTAFVQHASGLLAHIFQHEVDHLEGILFIDKAARTEPWEEFKKRELDAEA